MSDGKGGPSRNEEAKPIQPSKTRNHPSNEMMIYEIEDTHKHFTTASIRPMLGFSASKQKARGTATFIYNLQMKRMEREEQTLMEQEAR